MQASISNDVMKKSLEASLHTLAEHLVTAERFGAVQKVAAVATIHALYPDIPETAKMYEFPEPA